MINWRPMALIKVMAGPEEKWPKTKNNYKEELPGRDTKNILTSIDTHHCRKLAPMMFGCALGSKSQLRLTHLALTGLSG